MTLAPYPPAITLGQPVGPIDVAVTIPGSKSITNRALILAALAEGASRLRDPLESDDTRYMTQALRSLGVSIANDDADLVIEGTGGALQAPADPVIFVGNSGTSIRMLAAAGCLIPSGSSITLDGIDRMRKRPIADLTSALVEIGVGVRSLGAAGFPPIEIVGGGMPGGACHIKGDVSSQYLSALLMASPYAQQGVDVEIVGLLTSRPYVDITLAMMERFGVTVSNDDYRRFHVPGGQVYHGQDYLIEPDASNATYFLAAAAITGSTVTIRNLGPRAIQGDVRFVDVLRKMGCRVLDGDELAITGPTILRAVDVDMADMPDAAMTLAILCAFADGPSRLSGLSNLRVKETDRIHAIAAELRKLGTEVEETDDGWRIQPAAPRTGASIDTYDDHRMAMSFAVAGLRIPGLRIDDPGCVAKTFPNFWDLWEASLGVAIHPATK